MPVSPQDFNLWARMTGKKYPVTSEEKAAVAPEVHNFVRNIGKQGAVGEQEEQKQSSLAKNIAKGALIAGGVAAGVAAARDPRVQQAVRGFADTATQKASDFRESARGFAGTAAEKASNVRENVYSFLSNLGTPRVVDQDVVRASGDVTPNPIQQQQSGGATTPDSFEKYARSLEAPVGTVSPSTGQSSTLFDYERRAIPYPGARERAREQFARSLEAPVGTYSPSIAQSSTSLDYDRSASMPGALVRINSELQPSNSEARERAREQFARSLEAPVGTYSPSTGQSSTLFNLYDSIVQKYPDPGAGKDVEFQPSQIGISSGKESLATEPLTGERYRVGGGQSLIERGLEVTEPSARPQGQIIGKVGSLQSNRADQLINEYSQYLQGLVDREVNRETKVNKEIAALKEGAAMRVIDGLRAEAAQEKAIASNASQQTSAQEVAALVDPSVEYAQPEAQTDTTNSLFSSPVTPDNRVPKVSKVFDNSLKGQHDIATAIDNETDNVLSRSQNFLALQAKADPSPGQIEIDTQLNLFGPREPRATVGGRPYRYTQLERGPAPRFGESDPTGEQLSNIRGLGTQTVLDTGGVNISKLSEDPKTRTAQQQALDIFQATGDPSFLRSTFGVEGPSMPTQVTIGGRSVPTSELYTPFKTTEGGRGYEFEGGQIQRAIEELAPAEKFRETIKSLAQQQLGLAPGETPTQEQLRNLDPSTIRLLRGAASGVSERQSALNRAEDFAALYKLRPEITMGATQKPVVSSITGEYLGTRSAVDRPGVYTPELYRIRSAGGLSRQEVGGVGRRREMLASQEGYSPGGGSELDSSTVLFKDPETGNVLPPNQVTKEMTKYLKPIRGTAVEPQRILGQQGRTYKGVGTQEIDPRSFDTSMFSQIAKQSPERVTPEGLIYSTQALGGKARSEMLAEQQAARQAKDYARSIQLGAELAPKELGGVQSLPGIEEGEQLAKATGAELMGAMQTGTPQMREAAANVLAAREQRQKQTMSIKASQELNRILNSGRPNATREARAYLKGLQANYG